MAEHSGLVARRRVAGMSRSASPMLSTYGTYKTYKTYKTHESRLTSVICLA
jgi:hypothetical protein